MALSTKTSVPGTVSGRPMPPLENGDRLARFCHPPDLGITHRYGEPSMVERLLSAVAWA